MDPELSEVKPLRKKLDVTQQQLAVAAGVSQSLIAKVEAGLVDPSFSAGKKILAALRSFERKAEPTAKELMEARLVTIKANDSLKSAIKKMQARSFSQLPVMDGTNVAGLLTERSILKNLEKLTNNAIVREVMEEAPPVVPPTAPRKVLAELLTHYSLVLVKEKGRVKGVVTKADLLKSV